MKQLNSEKDDISTKLSGDVENLRAEIAAVQRDRDEQILVAETAHQQVETPAFIIYYICGFILE